MKKKILFIMNPISGTASKAAVPSLIDSVLDKELFEYEIRMTERAGHASEIATEAKNNHIDVVVAVGGDGTVNEVARSLVHSDTALGILPCGSGNGLARHLLLPMNLKKCIEVINQCQIRDLDYGVINDHPFFCTCGMGFDAFVSMKFAESGKRGPITYAENILREGLKYKPETYTLEDETGTKQYKAFLISCANASQYGNNVYIAPSASVRDGLMNVTIIEPFTAIEAPQMAIQLFNGTIEQNSRIKTFQCKRLLIKRKSPGVVHYDGEPMMTGENIDVRIMPGGLLCLSPLEEGVPAADKRFQNFINEHLRMMYNKTEELLQDNLRISQRFPLLNKDIIRKLSLK